MFNLNSKDAFIALDQATAHDLIWVSPDKFEIWHRIIKERFDRFFTEILHRPFIDRSQWVRNRKVEWLGGDINGLPADFNQLPLALQSWLTTLHSLNRVQNAYLLTKEEENFRYRKQVPPISGQEIASSASAVPSFLPDVPDQIWHASILKLLGWDIATLAALGCACKNGFGGLAQNSLRKLRQEALASPLLAPFRHNIRDVFPLLPELGVVRLMLSSISRDCHQLALIRFSSAASSSATVFDGDELRKWITEFHLPVFFDLIYDIKKDFISESLMSFSKQEKRDWIYKNLGNKSKKNLFPILNKISDYRFWKIIADRLPKRTSERLSFSQKASISRHIDQSPVDTFLQDLGNVSIATYNLRNSSYTQGHAEEFWLEAAILNPRIFHAIATCESIRAVRGYIFKRIDFMIRLINVIQNHAHCRNTLKELHDHRYLLKITSEEVRNDPRFIDIYRAIFDE